MNATDSSSTWLSVFAEAEPMKLPQEAIRPPSPERGPCTAKDLHLPRTMGEQNPHVSVIVPTYGDAEYLPDAIQSVGAQTFTDLELILVDSTGVDWLEDLAVERRWIRRVSSDPRGVSSARNDGLEAGRSPYVAFLDADDYWHPEKLERQFAAMTPEQPISYTGYYFLNYWNGDEPIVSRKDVTSCDGEEADIDLMMRSIDSHISTILCRSDIIPDRPFDEHLRNFEDILFAIERFRDYPPVAVPLPLAVRRLRPGSIADRTDEREKSRDRITVYEYLQDRYPEYTPQAQRMIALETYRMGIQSLKAGHIAKARSQFRESFQNHPSAMKAAALYLFTYIPFDPVSSYDRLEALLAHNRHSAIGKKTE